MAIKQVGFNFVIGSSLNSNFTANMNRTERGLSRIGEAVTSLNKMPALRLGNDLARQSGRISEYRTQLQKAQAELVQLNLQGKEAGEVSGLLARKIERTEATIAKVTNAMEREGRSYARNVVKAKQHAGSIAAMRKEYGGLNTALAQAKQRQDAYAASMAKSQKYAEQRKNLKGQIVGTAAMAGAAAAPLVLGEQVAQAKFRLSTAINSDNKNAAMVDAGKQARELSREGLASLTEAYDIQYALNSAGLDAAAARAGSSIVAKVSKVTNGQAESVGEVLATTYNNLGSSLAGTNEEKFARIGDLLTKTQLKFQIKDFGQLGESMKEGSAGLANYNVNLEQGVTLLGVLNSAGLGGSKAGTGMNAVLRQLGKAQKEWNIDLVRGANGQLDMVATLQQVNAALDGMGQDERAQAIQNVFGDEGSKAIVPMLKNLDSLSATVKDVSEGARGVVDSNIANYLKTATPNAAKVTNSLTDLAGVISSAVAPELNMMLDSFASGVNVLADFAREHTGVTKTVTGLVGGLIALKTAALGLGIFRTIMGQGFEFLKRGKLQKGFSGPVPVTVTNSGSLGDSDSGGFGMDSDSKKKKSRKRSGKSRRSKFSRRLGRSKAGRIFGKLSNGRIGNMFSKLANSKAGNMMGNLVNSKAGKFLGKGFRPLSMIMGAGSLVNSLSSGEKVGETVGSMAGGTGGSMAGSAIGAAIGSFILPGIGTAIGGMLGGLGGGMLGDWLGGAAGKQFDGIEQAAESADKVLAPANETKVEMSVTYNIPAGLTEAERNRFMAQKDKELVNTMTDQVNKMHHEQRRRALD
ncbi:phage tail tape measure protein [Halodesulfovibrio aestuarii]|uniref:Phage tail tape measure protein, TP901 family, core region n=1 Tax=Halodesulfovibrio aestuarii TaxID=126333 RepID=A0A8G2CDA1_9BACT|nr:phage tail tape measure protein [Halodesulfovibrio aestuarii]SHJ77185.1 phage tail tape measure protein, TP901 family, core region [Halodesulfovibrio aestuarii]